TRCLSDWSSDVCSSDLNLEQAGKLLAGVNAQTHSFPVLATKINQSILTRQCDEAIRLIQRRLAESRDLSDLERLFNSFFLVFARSEERRVGKECRARW